MKKSLFPLCLVTFLLMFQSVRAQDPLPGDPDDPGVPIDGGASLLVAAGVLYGAKKLKRFVVRKNDDQRDV